MITTAAMPATVAASRARLAAGKWRRPQYAHCIGRQFSEIGFSLPQKSQRAKPVAGGVLVGRGVGRVMVFTQWSNDSIVRGALTGKSAVDGELGA